MNSALLAVIVYVGCGTDAKHPSGLHAVDLDESSGRASIVASYPVPGATYQALSPDGTFLYSVTGTGLSSFRSDGAKLEHLDDFACGNPCHVSVMPDGAQVNWADYGKGTCGSVLVKDGRFVGGAVTHTHPRPSHCHQALPTPDGASWCVVDLGLDTITTYPRGDVLQTRPLGAGPRHLVFHPDGRLAFVVSELGNWLASYAWSATTGFSLLDGLSTIPNGDGRPNKRDYASAVRLTPDSRRVVVTNRGEESLAVYDFDEKTGRLSFKSRTKLPGSWPRDFAFVTPTLGMVAMERTGEVHVVRYQPSNGSFALVSTLPGLFRPAGILPAKR